MPLYEAERRTQSAERRMKKVAAARLACFFVLHSAFCVLRSPASDFKIARPPYEFTFPHDHGNHPDYRTEWWYYTGHLRTDGGKRYGFEVTFFRAGVTPPGTKTVSKWDVQHLMPAH